MTLNKTQIKSALWSGFLAGIILPFIVSFIGTNLIQGISVTFSALPATNLQPGFPQSVADFFVKVSGPVSSSLPLYILSGLGGALFFLLGTWIYSFRITPNAKTEFGKIVYILFYASIGLALLSVVKSGAVAMIPVLIISLVSSFVTGIFIYLLTKINVIKIPV